MAAPAGVSPRRWQEVVNLLVARKGWTPAAADTWLNAGWNTLFITGEYFSYGRLGERIAAWLVANP